MPDLPLGWATDVAVLQHTGSTVEDRGDHLVICTRENPLFHWGNCIMVTDPDAVDDADRWVREFQEAVPESDWVAIGLVRMPVATDTAGPTTISNSSSMTSSPRPLCRSRRRPQFGTTCVRWLATIGSNSSPGN